MRTNGQPVWEALREALVLLKHRLGALDALLARDVAFDDPEVETLRTLVAQDVREYFGVAEASEVERSFLRWRSDADSRPEQQRCFDACVPQSRGMLEAILTDLAERLQIWEQADVECQTEPAV